MRRRHDIPNEPASEEVGLPVVMWSPPTPLGLLPGRWVTTHRCIRCGQRVPPADLVVHAEAHGPEPDAEEVP